jgi:hypothetical protein
MVSLSFFFPGLVKSKPSVFDEPSLHYDPEAHRPGDTDIPYHIAGELEKWRLHRIVQIDTSSSM